MTTALPAHLVWGECNVPVHREDQLPLALMIVLMFCCLSPFLRRLLWSVKDIGFMSMQTPEGPQTSFSSVQHSCQSTWPFGVVFWCVWHQKLDNPYQMLDDVCQHMHHGIMMVRRLLSLMGLAPHPGHLHKSHGACEL